MMHHESFEVEYLKKQKLYHNILTADTSDSISTIAYEGAERGYINWNGLNEKSFIYFHM